MSMVELALEEQESLLEEVTSTYLRPCMCGCGLQTRQLGCVRMSMVELPLVLGLFLVLLVILGRIWDPHNATTEI